MNVLTVVPTYVRTPQDLEVVFVMLESLRATAPSVEILVVDDCSPASELVDEIAAASSRLQLEVVRRPSNEGFSATVNVGLRRALDEGKDALLANADLEFTRDGWLEAMLADPAAVVGAKLLYPIGLIQHSGIYFSLLHRAFAELHKFAPSDLPESMVRKVCPVTGALQLVRREALTAVGFYDEQFRMGSEDVDFCLRVFDAGLECAVCPDAVVVHHESLFRGVDDDKLNGWHEQSWAYFKAKHAQASFARWVPAIA